MMDRLKCVPNRDIAMPYCLLTNETVEAMKGHISLNRKIQ